MSSRTHCKGERIASRPCGGEDGYVLVASLLTMLLLVLAGIAVTSMTVLEVQVAANDRDYKRNFYRAEGAAMEAAQRLDNEEDTEELRPSLTSKPWLTSGTDYTVSANWTETGGVPDNYQVAALDGADTDVRLAAIGLGVVKGRKASSLTMTGSSVREYHLFGRSEERRGQVMIEVGYKKRF